MGGLLLASTGAGQLVSRWGRYKVFPVVGTFLMIVGLLLHVADRPDHRRMDHRRLSVRVRCRAGPGHAGPRGRRAERRALRAAGHGDFGGDVLPHDRRLLRHRGVRRHLRQPSRHERRPRPASRSPFHPISGARSTVPTRRRCSRLPPAVHAGVVAGMVHTIQTVFLIAVPDRGRGVRVVVAPSRHRAAQDGAHRRPGQGARDARVALVARGDPARPGTPRSAREPP